MQKQWSKYEILLLMARFNQSPRFNTNSPAYTWDAFNQNMKKPLYPSSYTIMEVLEVSNWEEVKILAQEEYKKWQAKLNKTDVRKEINQYLGQYHYIELLSPYKDEMESTAAYKALREKLADEIELPSLNSIIVKFGTWAKFKYALGETERISVGRKKRYTEQDLLKILDEYTKQFPFSDWDNHAKELNLPMKITFLTRLTKAQLKPYLNNGGHRDTDELVEIAWRYREQFISYSIRNWTVFAKEKKIPTKQTFINHWGKYNYHKIMDYLKREEASLKGLQSLLKKLMK